MDPEAALTTVVDSASAALRSRTMVPSAMLTVGIFQAVAAFALFFYKTAPEGIFSHHGKAVVFVYYVVLVAGVIVGSATASASFWVARLLDDRHGIGMALLCASTLTLIPVFGILVGFVMLKK
jgi:hypothetical protein